MLLDFYRPVMCEAAANASMEEDVFSILTDDTCLMAVLLYTGPKPRSLGALFLASPHVRKRLSTPYFARKFLSLYLGVNVSATLVDISWWDELKKWFTRRNELYDIKFDFRGQEVDQLENGDGEPIVTVKNKSNGIVTAERTWKTAPLSESVSQAVMNSFADFQMTVMQPQRSRFAHLPLSRAHSMYYEVKVIKPVPKRGGAVIGYALPSLKITLPGRTSFSFGVALDTLLVFNGFSQLPERIPSPRGENFKLKKGDTFGVGLVYSFSNLKPPYESHLATERNSTANEPNHPETATFYVTFNGQMIYHKPAIFITYQLVPTFVLASYGDAIRINFGAPSVPSHWISSQEHYNALKTGNINLEAEPIRFYHKGWKYDPTLAYKELPPESFTDHFIVEGQDSEDKENPPTAISETERRLGPKVKRNFYWQSLDEQDEAIVEATAERLWLDPSFHHFGRHHQITLDFLHSRVEEHNYVPLVKLQNIAKCVESANMQRLVTNGMMTAETARTLYVQGYFGDPCIDAIQLPWLFLLWQYDFYLLLVSIYSDPRICAFSFDAL